MNNIKTPRQLMFFLNCTGQSIASMLNSVKHHQFNDRSHIGPEITTITPTTLNEVLAVIGGMLDKSSQLDIIPTSI